MMKFEKIIIVVVISIAIIIISYRFLNVEVLPVVLGNSEYYFSAVFSNMYLRNKELYIGDIKNVHQG